jgi:hypothetical protein
MPIENGMIRITMNFLDVVPGDIVHRSVYGEHMSDHKVAAVDDELIHCAGGWTFDRESGVEEDPELGMGIKFGIVGTYLTGYTHDGVLMGEVDA